MSHVDDGTLHAYLDGELSAAEAQRVDAHLAQCPACRTRLDEERALITRAGELLALAAPPDRELPPFRTGDVKPAPRLWWRVRLPLAWAATVALALGIGTYVGGRGGPGIAPRPYARSSKMADGLAPSAAPVPQTPGPAEREARPSSHEPRTSPSRPAPAPAVGAIAEVKPEKRSQALADSLVALSARDEAVAPRERSMVAAKAVAPAPLLSRLETFKRDGAGALQKEGPITADSARAVLGRDPMVVPDLPIRGLYRGQIPGYSGLVIVEQALDSTTTIDVVNGPVPPLGLAAVAVRGANGAPPPRPDMPSPGAQAAGHAVDSLAPTRAARQRAAEPPAFYVDVLGPVSADSLAVLKRRLRPLPR